MQAAVEGSPQPLPRFVVAVFLADDSIGVWELKTRNSGHNEAPGFRVFVRRRATLPFGEFGTSGR